MGKSTVPYAEYGMIMLKCIFSALGYLVSLDRNLNEDELSEEEMKKLKDCFKPFYDRKADKKDAHLSDKTNRLPNLLVNAYADIQNEPSVGYCIPSPLYVLFQMLTVPEQPQSAAYVLLLCRSMLYEMFRVFPEHPLFPEDYTSFNMLDINDIRDSFAKAVSKNDNIATTTRNRVKLMLAHFIAMKGIFYLRFNTSDDRDLYLEKAEIPATVQPEFHKVSYYDKLPDASSLMNELNGIPIAIKGMDTILQGGLKTDSNSSLVVLVSGNPGSGKTSFALALSAVLSPFGTQSFYLSVEEKAADLKERLQSLYPEYLTGLSFYKDMDKEKEEWFWPTNIPVSKIKYEERFEHFDEMLRQIGENLNDKTPEGREKALPAVCPLIIVIDSIRPFIRKEVNLEGFIERCRNLNAVVILVSSSSKEFHHEIDYMVDVVINLEYSDTETPKEKPVRILQLLKTRRQISRPGAHVFHLSGNGIHVSPQLPSQIDKIEIISRPVPSSSYYIDFYKENCTVKTNLVLWDESQILLHGYGSTGKAGLALHLLMYPLKIKKGKNISDEDPYIQRKRKVLVVSLLYPPQYYKGIERYMKTNAKFQHASLECICFYSGYLTPEDFISKILAKLDTAILEGAPFTGILLDGLHNAPLQFPRLQAGDMVWSTLYSLIAKYCLTIVTTFTNFKIEKEIDENGGILLKDDKLLLNIMIQAADYYFHIQKSDKSSGKYIVTLNSAIRHRMMVNPEHFLWDREDFKLGDDDVKIKDKQKNLDFED